jgi:predicted GIY-YIG superfamily endonuclease
MKQHNYFVYITSNPTKTVLYVGMTNDLYRSLVEHRETEERQKLLRGDIIAISCCIVNDTLMCSMQLKEKKK